jgi:hypothetical protein
VSTEFRALEETFQQGGQKQYWELSLKFESARRDSDHLIPLSSGHGDRVLSERIVISADASKLRCERFELDGEF